MKSASVTAVSPSNRFERRRERTRQDLLAAAERVLADKGLDHTKISDIAAAADVGVGTFYLHFPTKEALFDAVVEDTMRRFKATIDTARLSTDDPIGQMRAANAAFCRFACDNREVFRIVFGHAAAYNEVIGRAQALFAEDVEESYRHGVATGAFASMPPALVAQAIIGMATQVLSWWTANESVSIESLHETMFTLSLDGLRARTPKKGSST